MIAAFDPKRRLILVAARFTGPGGNTVVRLALDTGSTRSVISWAAAIILGYDPAASSERIQLTTGSGVEFAPWVTLNSITALGSTRRRFRILCHSLPASAEVDDLLGLDFLRGRRLIIDFPTANIELS